MIGFGRRTRTVAVGIGVVCVATLIAVGARELPADVRWALLVVTAPYLLGGGLLVVLPVLARLRENPRGMTDRVSRD